MAAAGLHTKRGCVRRAERAAIRHGVTFPGGQRRGPRPRGDGSPRQHGELKILISIEKITAGSAFREVVAEG